MTDPTMADRLRKAEVRNRWLETRNRGLEEECLILLSQRDAALARIAALEAEAKERESCEGCENLPPQSVDKDACPQCARRSREDYFKKRESAGGVR